MNGELKSLKNEFQDSQNKQQEIISQEINIVRSNLTATRKHLADVEESFRNRTEESQVQLKSLTKQLNDLRANFTETINRVEKQSMTYYSGLSSRVDTESSLRKARPSNYILCQDFLAFSK